MKQRLFIILAFIVLIVILIGLNAVSYTQKDTLPDSEEMPNRSTFNSGATGTRAFYDLLAETGRKVTRWQENPAALLGSQNKPKTLVIIGNTRREITDAETVQILRWVSEGGKLVIIDRNPNTDLIATTANWRVSVIPTKDFVYGIDPTNLKQITEKTEAAKPLQPTVFTRDVNAVQPSRFASSIKLDFYGEGEPPVIEAAPNTTKYNLQAEPPPVMVKKATPVKTASPQFDRAKDAAPPPPMMEKPISSASPVSGIGKKPAENPDAIALNAPFVHLTNNQKTILADFPYGLGQIVYLTDPYLVSNAGISYVDNAQLAINLVATRDGLIAFDEYHQGYGANESRLLEYFAGTPILWIFGQIVLLVILILWSQSKRFARPLPADEPSRISKLEYVSAFAELQQRTKAYDLALENIYSEFRRSMTKLFGMDNSAGSSKELAKLIAERGKLNEIEVYNTMRQCEEIIQGEPTGKREILKLTARLREIEEALGLKRVRKNS